MPKKLALKTTPTYFNKCLEFLQKMSWHLSFTPDTNKFSVLAYRSAYEALASHGSLEGIETVKGIGKTMLDHFEVLCQNKTPNVLRDISRNGPPFQVRELTRIAGVGEKTAAKLYETYKVASIKDLDDAIKAHKITDPKLISAYLDLGAVDERIPRTTIEENIAPILASIRKIIGEETLLEHVGSFRRHRPDVRDVDLLVGTDDAKTIKDVTAAMKKFADQVRLVDKEGAKKCEVQIKLVGRQRKLDVYFVQPKCWGSALMHFTGPDRYNVAVRMFAKKRKLKVNQYGVTDLTTKKIKRFQTEQAMCEYLGIPYLEPELRDHFPDLKDVKSLSTERLITTDMVIGDLHVHSTDSDGKALFSDIFKWYTKSRFKFLGTSDHSHGTGGGLDDKLVLKRHERIRERYGYNHGDKMFTRKTKTGQVKFSSKILCGAEVDIKTDGTLDYLDKTLKTFDYVILSIHHSTDKKPTERLLSAIEKIAALQIPCILAHPTNRRIGYRAESQVDWQKVLPKCAEHRIAVEINGQGDRIDAPDGLIQKAKHAGCVFVVSSDFHGTTHDEQKKLITQAVMQARRGWLTQDLVVNCSTKLFAKWISGETYRRLWGIK